MDENYSISLKKTWEYIKSDLARYHSTDKRSYPALLVMAPGIIAGFYYRIGHWIWYPAEINRKWLRILRPFYMVGKRLVEVYSGVSLSTQARIGRGLYISHFGPIFVGASVIGDNCNLSQQVTLGVAGRGEKRGLPTLGNRVFVGAGAKVLGPIQIGNDVSIGANAVVTKDLDDRAVAVGVPAKIVSHNGSFDFVIYDTMDNDPDRARSFRAVRA
jgi:serine O-acetyltransferase